MNIIGLSGLHNSVDFKTRRLPGLSAREYRIVQGLDSAAALVTESGVRAAAAEERFSRDKGTGAFPVAAMKYCLDFEGIRSDEVDAVAHAFSYEPFAERFNHGDEYQRDLFTDVYSAEAFLSGIEASFPGIEWRQRLVRVEHHLAHAASAFYLSGFDESLILVSDGMGEIHSTTVAVGTREGISVVRQVPAVHSLGIFYGVFTLYLGFMMNMDEYKVMGLAAHGDPRHYIPKVMDLLHIQPYGMYSIPILFENPTLLERETYRGTLARLSELFGPAREPDGPLTSHHADIAAAVQAVLQAALLHMLRYFRRETGQANLSIAGGVGLNCTANGILQRSRIFKRVFVQPAAGDDGAALGAALYVRHARIKDDPPSRMGTPMWGPAYGPTEIEAALAARPECRHQAIPDSHELVAAVAERLAAGQIGAWFQGRLEFGPRALGGRSILADPRDPDMRDRLNRVVKKREEFRPFAPAVPAEVAGQFFDVEAGHEQDFAHMLFTTMVRHEHRSRLPAVTHADGSARLQTVDRSEDPLFWALLHRFGHFTGIPVLVNTSFNVRGQPIVCSPEEAINTYLMTEIDFLVLGEYLVLRRDADRSLA